MLTTTDGASIQRPHNRFRRRATNKRGPARNNSEQLSNKCVLESNPANIHDSVGLLGALHINQEKNIPTRDNDQKITDEKLWPTPNSILSPSSKENLVPDDVGSHSNSQSNHRGHNKGGRGRGRFRHRVGRTRPVLSKQEDNGIKMTSNISHDKPQEPSSRNSNEVLIGQSRGSRSRKNTPFIARERKLKSQPRDVATRIHEDIKHRQYECLICTNQVLFNSKIWACKTCWSVLHLACVSRWARNAISTFLQSPNLEQEISVRKWRCPGCNLPQDNLPTTYFCWCSKECEPHTVAGLPPHSCGQTCGRARANNCPHPCESTCHAGPCLPCSHMGPSISCFCGKSSVSKKCLETNYGTGWSCKQICGNIMPCGIHKCRKICHEGSCGSCELLVKSRCYCAKVAHELPCSGLDDLKASKLDGESWLGFFNCGTKCHQLFDCGNPKHFCEKLCHKQDDHPAHCPFSPDVISRCPCGKTPLHLLLDSPRRDCSAKIPNCQKKCDKTLSCGHYCEMKCHTGVCGPCQINCKISCRCGRTISDILCHQGSEELLLCSRVCRSMLNCGRHECSNRCCNGEKKASERLASKRKHRGQIATLSTANDYESEHICLKICGRPLKCGLHNCSSLCHKGPCPTCLEAIFDDISCACGRTILQPPQPCGTTAPQCTFDCIRQPTCGHPEMKHQCHSEKDPCPQCIFLMEKKCICGKKTLKNQPCWFNEVRCGLTCGKKMKCGIHICQKPCHRDGQCEDSNSACTQLCGRKRLICDHPCRQKCHAPYPCKETEPCQAKTFITCACQNQKQQVKCFASTTVSGNPKKELTCNDDCLKIQRNAKLADALKIDLDTHKDDHIPYSTKTLTLFSSDQKFGQLHEREFRVFASNENEKKKRFKPMPAKQREFIHSLAEDFGLVSESLDNEPHRHVSIFKTPRFVSAPLKTLNQCVKATKIKSLPFSVKPLLNVSLESWNAILIEAPRFGLTVDEIKTAIKNEFESSILEFEISFLPSENFILRVVTTGINPEKISAILESKKITLAKIVSSLGLADTTILCSVDNLLNILKREDSSSKHDGWNQVVKGASSVKKVIANVEKKNSFIALGKSKKENLNKLMIEETPDDWERELENWD